MFFDGAQKLFWKKKISEFYKEFIRTHKSGTNVILNKILKDVLYWWDLTEYLFLTFQVEWDELFTINCLGTDSW